MYARADLAPLSRLDVLDVHANRLTSLQPLAHLTSLRIINAASNYLSTLCDLSILARLVELNLRRNSISSLQLHGSGSSTSTAHAQDGMHHGTGTLALPSSLQRLFLDHNNFAATTSLAGLKGVTGLKELGLDGCPLFRGGATQLHPQVHLTQSGMSLSARSLLNTHCMLNTHCTALGICHMLSATPALLWQAVLRDLWIQGLPL